MVITPGINHFPCLEAPLCSPTEKTEYILTQNHPAQLHMLLLPISAKLDDFTLTPRCALTWLELHTQGGAQTSRRK